VNALLSCKVISAQDCGSHTLFVADLTEARSLQGSVRTYEYYRSISSPRPAQKPPNRKTGLKKWVCTVCGYIYEGESLRRTSSAPSASTARRYSCRWKSPLLPHESRTAKPAEPAKPAETAKPEKPATKKWLCTVCGYIYEGDELPRTSSAPSASTARSVRTVRIALLSKGAAGKPRSFYARSKKQRPTAGKGC
jgi:rubredoxin